MGIISIFAIAIGLSMDAFAVSLCKGMCVAHKKIPYALVVAAFFGTFQGVMPIVGWAVGSAFASYIESVDHWIAFILLGLIGAKMIWDAVKSDELNACSIDGAKINIGELTLLAIATSIDALAVGISFAFLGAGILIPALIIAFTTFLLSFIGVLLGAKCGNVLEKRAGIAGGIILILIGLKILLEHLDILYMPF